MIEEPLIHIGYHKTASTWLQENLFKTTPFKNLMAMRTITEQIVLPNALNFDATKVRDFYNSLDTGKNYVPVISHERLSGSPHSGGYDVKELADRLKSVFPKGKILIVIREQSSLIFSWYLQYIRVGGPCSISSYLNPPQTDKENIPLFDFDYFDYTKPIKYYYKIFGKENVLVLPYELFAQNAADFCGKISNFCHITQQLDLPYSKVSNQRISTLSSFVLRQGNRVLRKTYFNPFAFNLKSNNQEIPEDKKKKTAYQKLLLIDSLIPKTIHKFFDKRLKDFVKTKVGDRYKTANQELSEIINYDLQSLGY